ncbi:MAG: hypothetical protein VKL39_20530 [Leptolyngbyaceae bacterium]|nr:hypothetical protein [Leptolyngbyaceae bacterium]
MTHAPALQALLTSLGSVSWNTALSDVTLTDGLRGLVYPLGLSKTQGRSQWSYRVTLTRALTGLSEAIEWSESMAAQALEVLDPPGGACLGSGGRVGGVSIEILAPTTNPNNSRTPQPVEVLAGITLTLTITE